jgi:ketosteroid isomerase-like protein
MDVDEVLDAGENVVVVDRQSGRGRGSGIPLAQQTASVWTVRDGKVVRIVWFLTRGKALQAAGLSE